MDAVPPNHQAEARAEALRRVRARLAAVDMESRARALGLGIRHDRGLELALFGRALTVTARTLEVTAEDGESVSPQAATLVLRYLEIERVPEPTGEEVPFRDLPGGGFYHAALARRTGDLLVRAFGNDLTRLKQTLERYPHEGLDFADVGARVQAIGSLGVSLLYRAGDEEFPPSADLLFDRVISSAYTLDETAALATLLCTSLATRRT